MPALPYGPLLFAVALVVLVLGSLLMLVRTAPAPADLSPEEMEALAWSTGSEDRALVHEPPHPARPSAALSLTTTPSGAIVWLNADRLGMTPLRLPYVEPGYHFISVEHPGYRAVDTLLLLENGMEVQLDLTLQAASAPRRNEPAPSPEPEPPVVEPRIVEKPAPVAPTAGSLRITSQPSGAEVFIGGQRRGRTPLHLGELPPGTYQVEVVHPDFTRFTDRVRVSAGKEAVVSARLAPRPMGTLVVTVRPWGSVYVDGALRHEGSPGGGQPSVYRAALPPGTYRIRVTHPQYGSWDRTVEVTAGQSAEVYFDLVALSAEAFPLAPQREAVGALAAAPVGRVAP